MKRTFTTSAQKTLTLPKDVILKKLEDEMTKDASVVFKATKQEHIKEAILKDGSKIVIAAFDKDNGKTLAMIDHKNLPDKNIRADIQSKMKQSLIRYSAKAAYINCFFGFCKQTPATLCPNRKSVCRAAINYATATTVKRG